MTSLALDNAHWDLTLDSQRDLALISGGAGIVQDVCCAVQTWIGEAWYDLSLGLPYDGGILGAGDSPLVYASFVEAAAQAVPGVASVKCAPAALTPDRRLSGTIAVQTLSGEVHYAAL